MKKDTLEILVIDCMTHRLTEEESLKYIETRYKKIHRRTLRRRKREILDDDSLQMYFNEHTRIGFVIDQRNRKNEMESILDQLMRRWKDLTSKENADIYKIVRLSNAIVEANKRLEDISLSNPVISKIKEKVDLLEAGKASREDDTGV